MKNFLFILLFTIVACSPEQDDDLVDTESADSVPLDSLNLEADPSLKRNTANLIYTETFENPDLSTNPQAGEFYLEHAVDHSFQLEENIKREGSTAGRFEIRKGDPKIWGGHRTEMSQTQSTAQNEGWYGISQYFPETYVSDTSGEVLLQWHDQSDAGEAVDRSPSNALIAADNRLKWMIRWDSDKIMNSGTSDGTIYIDLGQIPKKQWMDLVVHIKYSHTNTGILEVWMDGEKVIDRQNMPNSYNDTKYPYFKFGVYKWEWGNPATQRVIYFDEVRVGTKNSSYEDVEPNTSAEEVKTDNINMMVNSYNVDCVGEMEGTCLLVQEGGMIGTENWENFYNDNIEGFTYEPGFVYGLLVKKTKVENPPADGSSIRYVLESIVSKVAQ